MFRKQPTLLSQRTAWVARRICSVSILLLACGSVTQSQITLPPVPPSCTLEQGDIGTYIISQSMAAGHVPDNDKFSGTNDCKFHQAAMRMFLWLTSRQNASHDSYVFNSRTMFYDVPANTAGQHRTVRRAPPGTFSARPGFLNPTITQSGPGGTSTIFDDTGRMYTVVRPVHIKISDGAARLKIQSSPVLKIQSFTITNEGHTIKVRAGGRRFMIDSSGQVPSIDSPQLLDKDKKQITFSGKVVFVNGIPIPLDTGDRAVDYEPGQAGRVRRALMTADGRLVYYGIRVNDVFQRFSDKFNSMRPQPTKFPSSLVEVERIDNTLPDAKALVIETKTSWIDVCGGIPYDNCDTERKKYDGKYITLDAQIIPTYVPPSPNNGSILLKGPDKKTTLALLGMHVTFTANGNPKGFAGMLWSTFEHVNNARNVAYSYDPLGQQPPKPFDGGGDWLLAGSATSCSKDNVDAKKVNIPRMNIDGQNIVRVNKHSTIGPSDVCRISPWGNFEGTGSQNAGIISINASLWDAFKTYAPADVRKNYMLLGTTWMINEAMPPEHNSGHQGTHSLANSTMETFQQGKFNNCLTCHRDEEGAPLLNVSHIWRQLHPYHRRSRK